MEGTLTQHDNVPSQHVAPRHVTIWLPPGYEDGSRRYPILYMHDGQNLFDTATAYGGETWGVAETMTQLIAAGTVPPTIVVGVWNTENRWQEYMPQRPLTTLANPSMLAKLKHKFTGPLLADAYLRFLVTELKPFIDHTYRTQPQRAATTIMGSSMGGLISLYALCEYPDIFSGAGCVSTHWPAGDGIVVDTLAAALPAPGRHKLYFDYGTITLDAEYEPYQQRVDAIMTAAGWRNGQDWITRKFEGAAHNEISWRARVHIPLAFLLG